MAESIIIHFLEKDASKIAAVIDEVFSKADPDCWRFPSEDYLVSVSEYLNTDTEYEDSEIAGIVATLGRPPWFSLDFEIRRSRSDEACDFLEAFLRERLCGFAHVIDDMFRLLPHTDMARVDDLLDCYRYRKGQNQPVETTAPAARSPRLT